MASAGDALKRKALIISELAEKLRPESIDRAALDHHARRRPIPCGMTIHTGVGCSYGCVYCYIYDMGFTSKPAPYPLSGEELVLALSLNPYFIPGRCGTLLAFGSVTEPFMPATIERAFEYLRAARVWLENPQQISTKTALRGKELDIFLDSADPRIDVLVSLSTVDKWRLLEPGASPPEERFRFMKALADAGVSVTLFLRPIIPGVTDMEYQRILSKAADAGVKKIVVGSLRVTRRILRRLEAARVVDIREVRRRLVRTPRRPEEQVPIYSRDLKYIIESAAVEMGFKVLPASCSSNIDAHGQYCNACRLGPCGNQNAKPRITEDDIKEVFEVLGVKVKKLKVNRGRVRAVVDTSGHGKWIMGILYNWISGMYRVSPEIRRV
ncbi:MAG: radical SAM protein [Aeropyrum sp.]|nr:radical SAM protein [Aeropyrum sp.]MCE4615651.1 radical SAM protein [Aeropyrum sp.]